MHEVESTIPEQFTRIARSHAARIAISDGPQQLTYTELRDRALELSSALLASGVRPGDPVAILADQGASAVVALFGVAFAGGVFAPLDVLDPPARAGALVELVGARIVITTSARRENARAIQTGLAHALEVLDVDDLRPVDAVDPPPLAPSDPASIFFTSGSTGTPKAVLDLHRNVLHNVHRYTTLLEITPADRLSVVQRPSFSGIASSVFGALLNGATLCPFPLDSDNLLELAGWIRRERITIFHSVPAIFRVLTSAGAAFPDVRIVRLEGDRATWDDVDRFRRAFSAEAILANGLGTTETGLASQFRITRATRCGAGVLPVGRPAPDIELLVLDDDGKPVADGVVGEVAVRSRFLACGYVGSPALTAERFVTIEGGSRVYRTGDLGRVDGHGSLEVLGRLDGTAKIGGIRVEPAEIESVILSLDNIRDVRVAIAPARSGGGTLTAVVVPVQATTPDDIRMSLEARLPAHMIPARIRLVAALPVDESWKTRPATRSRAPRAGLEAALAAIWEEILETAVGADDRFVELGGDSLAAAEIAAAIEERLGLRVSPAVLSRSPTVTRLAAELEGSTPVERVRMVALAGASKGVPLVFVPDHRGDPLMFAEVARRLAPLVPTSSVALSRRGSVDDLSIPAVAHDVVTALRTDLPEGPYRLCGFCYGALLTIEVTRLLRADGAEVTPVLLGLLPSDLEAVVAPDALARWRHAFGRRPLGLTRVRYHMRRARRHPWRRRAGYVWVTARRGVAHIAARARPAPSGTLGAGADGFSPERLPGTATVILAADTVREYASDANEAWAGLADDVDLRLVPGAWTDAQLLGAAGSALLADAIGDLLEGPAGCQTVP